MVSAKSTGATHATQPETTWQNISFPPNSGSLLSATPSNWETTLQSSQKTPKTCPLHHSSRPTASNQTTETYSLSSPLPMSKFTNPQQETHSLRKPSKQLSSATMTNPMVSSSTIQQQNNFSDPAISDSTHPILLAQSLASLTMAALISASSKTLQSRTCLLHTICNSQFSFHPLILIILPPPLPSSTSRSLIHHHTLSKLRLQKISLKSW
mmetsp:Transcript_12606/g.18870  ORF Transcript_12606/g.18870 Transcript_12606/m.18870 type:complete len:211 (+) Transcript_12606:1921-2553(+)